MEWRIFAEGIYCIKTSHSLNNPTEKKFSAPCYLKLFDKGKFTSLRNSPNLVSQWLQDMVQVQVYYGF